MKSPLREILKADRMKAMREGDTHTKDVLTVLLGDLESDEKRGNHVDDAYVVKTIKKASINASENYKVTNDEKYAHELELLNRYLPKQLSESKLSDIIDSILVDLTDKGTANMGTIMKTLKENFNGQYDGKLASKLVKEKL